MRPVWGAVLAGGRNRRYGAHKALVPVGGVPILERVRTALAGVVDRTILIANEPEVYAAAGLPLRQDLRPDLGPLGGIHAALSWAREEDALGIIAVACDMPFLAPELLLRLRREAEAANTPDVVVPESPSRRGLEPLCAFYSVNCLPAIESRAATGDLRLVGFHELVRVARVPLEDVAAHGEPEVLFLNVNTPAERVRAEALAGGRPRRGSGTR